MSYDTHENAKGGYGHFPGYKAQGFYNGKGHHKHFEIQEEDIFVYLLDGVNDYAGATVLDLPDDIITSDTIIGDDIFRVNQFGDLVLEQDADPMNPYYEVFIETDTMHYNVFITDISGG